MSLVEFTEYIVKSIVQNEDSVSVKEFASTEDDEILIQVLVDESDVGLVIGKNAKMLNSITTLVQASSKLNDNKRVKINIDSF